LPHRQNRKQSITIIQSFQEQLKSGELEVPLKQELPTLIDSSTTIFNNN